MRVILALALCELVMGGTPLHQQAAPLPLDQALVRARAGGKYAMLLRQIRVEVDREKVSDFSDRGLSDDTTLAGYTDLPKGYRVYVYPYWYIWRDRVEALGPKRAWGPEQATGLPDTPEPGDIQTAWASATPDGADEWLMLEYKTPVHASAVRIYESYNPGAVVRITAFALDGRELEVWRRPAPVIPDSPYYVFRPGFRVHVLTNRIRIHLDSRHVPGWNEIDAVGLVDESGGIQWATSAHASSTYGVQEDRMSPEEDRARTLTDTSRLPGEEVERERASPH